MPLPSLGIFARLLARRFRRHLLSLRSCSSSRLPAWHALMDKRIGIIPLPVYAVILGCLGAFSTLNQVPDDLPMTAATLAVLGFTCAELGARLPSLRHIGGPVIVTTFLSSYLVYDHWLPLSLTQAIGDFWRSTNIVYLFIASVTVGSVLSMERQVFIQGFAKLFLPLAMGSVVAAGVGTMTGMALGLSAHYTFFYIVIPIMAGGVGEGAIPLTLGYADMLQQPQASLLAQVMPAVVLGNLTAIVCVSFLKQLGKRYPQLTGQGRLQPIGNGYLENSGKAIPTVEQIAAAGITAMSLYMLGALVHQLTGFPAPVAMLFLAVLARLAGAVPPTLEDGSHTVHLFFSRAVTYPLLFAIGAIVMPFNALLTAFTLANFVTIIATVVTLTTVGFFAGRWVGLYPVESAIVAACHSGMGGIGDIAILTVANRMPLMPFAQLATRLGGAITITAALVLLVKLT